MNRLKELKARCKGGVSIFFDEHKVNYAQVDDQLVSDGVQVSKDIKDKMNELDSMVYIYFYPDTPIGLYTVNHYDIGLAVDECLRILNNE